MKLKVLIGCEKSGVMKREFLKAGCDAYSCDLEKSEDEYNHIQEDVLKVVNFEEWDLFIAHPPCTYLSYAGNRYWNIPGREDKRMEALNFFYKLMKVDIKYKCIENPLGIVDKVLIKHTQIIHPFYFGDKDLKRTCLWLFNLPLLKYSFENNLFEKKTSSDYPKPVYVGKNGKRYNYTESLTKNDFRRSKSFQGVGRAMAEQFTKYIKEEKRITNI